MLSSSCVNVRELHTEAISKCFLVRPLNYCFRGRGWRFPTTKLDPAVGLPNLQMSRSKTRHQNQNIKTSINIGAQRPWLPEASERPQVTGLSRRQATVPRPPCTPNTKQVTYTTRGQATMAYVLYQQRTFP